MADNTPITNPATVLNRARSGRRHWWVRLVTLAASAVRGDATGHQRRSHGPDCACIPRPGNVPRWRPSANVVVDVITSGLFKSAIVIQLVHLLLFHGGAR
jgi:hypothetical protein